MGLSKHDKIAENLSKKYKSEYNKGPGPDVNAKERAIEVVSHESDLYSSLDQLKRFRKPTYIATPSELVKKAKEVTKGTGIGVMGPTGTIRKKAGGK
ncbi:hypothetical protein KAR91_10080 [Candidatus Pacearchaeota archaeon]|nr:hypothetical protein [Candidatus Pacearchaeota archaeon]